VVWLDQAGRLATTGLLPRRALRAVLAGHVLAPIAADQVPQSIDLALAVADASEMLGELFPEDGASDLTGGQQQLLLMVKAGIVGVVPPAVPSLKLTSVSLDGDDVLLQLTVTGPPALVSGLRFERGSTSEHMPVTHDEDGSVECRYPVAELGNTPVVVSADLDLVYGTVSERLQITAAHAVNRPTGPLIIATVDGELCIVPAESGHHEIGRDELARQFLSASVTTAVAAGPQLRLVLTPEREAVITAARLFRDVNGTALSRPFACTVDADGQVVAVRRSSDVVNRRWIVLATFRTPFGELEYPVKVSGDAIQPGTGGYSLRAAGGTGLHLFREASMGSATAARSNSLRSLLGRSKRVARSIGRSLKGRGRPS
jgi:hypothetical protein